MNKQFYIDFCEVYRSLYNTLNLKTENLLLEIGGKRKLEVLIYNIIQKVEKQYEIPLKNKFNSIVDFGCYLLVNNTAAIDECMNSFKN